MVDGKVKPRCQLRLKCADKSHFTHIAIIVNTQYASLFPRKTWALERVNYVGRQVCYSSLHQTACFKATKGLHPTLLHGSMLTVQHCYITSSRGSRNCALPQDSHPLRGSIRDLWAVALLRWELWSVPSPALRWSYNYFCHLETPNLLTVTTDHCIVGPRLLPERITAATYAPIYEALPVLLKDVPLPIRGHFWYHTNTSCLQFNWRNISLTVYLPSRTMHWPPQFADVSHMDLLLWGN
jgi:hypothetical protein